CARRGVVAKDWYFDVW
nr:immunoglobulin heavy chain junction region [Mus musculus]MBK4196344.1 immunoglobulin heavy chain junction region [Mus musculus]MBK4196345.1 immunoglobulin heavy chain junction region [Mus musculus]MBK4196346.1 immunoglobulin heavy chain junction region [Mus musculus]